MTKITIILSALTFTGCFSPEYSQNYVSVDEAKFEQYKEEAGERPSPPNRTSVTMGETKVYITYSQPSVKGRTIWGDLVKYNEIWRTGANEATVFSTTGDVLVNGDTVRAGNYALYTIPSEEKWTVILNTKYDVWGAYDYEVEKDILRFDAYPLLLDDLQEKMTFEIDDLGTVDFSWDNLGFKFYVMPI
ncbi:MAG: DUF2911 domain-containing protein [Reichenbachiella sp.]